GSEIWDEKMLGTAHIALGANKPFGGIIRGDYHRDLVFYPVNIKIGRRKLRIPWKARPDK
ncbi:MAG: hypothetical protein D3924_04535, partial [Candidatus Electrothrix sp. AR4]|nr:hypothetical protein [Candidatus Electrothrix sp. AR4]